MNNTQQEIVLKQSSLSQIHSSVKVPSYNRESIQAGIVHIGVGGFHRSHQAYYIHQLMAQYNALEWGICGVGLRQADQNIAKALQDQDGLYTLITQHPNGDIDNEVIGSIKEFLWIADGKEPIVAKMALPSTKIVSLTITEGGYNFNTATQEFNFENPDIIHELNNPDDPKTVYGFVAEALRRRKKAGLEALTIMSCDNIQHNGAIAQKMFHAFIERQDAELFKWVKEHVTFPNTMVDRITPVTTKQDIAYLEKEFGLQEQWPVTCEPFIQWVVEDKFVQGRPALEKVGVQFVEDVTPYEKMKIRLLNAGHSVLGICGALHAYPTINACMQDKELSGFMRKFMDTEATKVLDPVQGIDLNDYKDILENRFANPNIKDTVSRICSESSAKLPVFLIPTLKENLHNGGEIKCATLVLAAWYVYHHKLVDQKQQPLEVIDVLKNELHQNAKDPILFLQQKDIFGDLVDNEKFVALCQSYISQILDTNDILGVIRSI